MKNTEWKEEFLLDMLQYYCEDPIKRRCRSKGQCCYSPATLELEDSEGCPIGRRLDPELALNIDERYGEIDVASLVRLEQITLPGWLNMENIDFLQEVQNLHDCSIYWTNMGLSGRGILKVKAILHDNNLNEDKFSKFLD